MQTKKENAEKLDSFCNLLNCIKSKWGSDHHFICKNGHYLCREGYECIYISNTGKLRDIFEPIDDGIYKQPLIILAAFMKCRRK